MIEKLSIFLAKKILYIEDKKNNESNENLEVLQYGLECIINTIVPMLIIFIYAFIMKQVPEMVLWTISFLLLRNYLGGYHASSHIRCMFLSSITGIIALYIEHMLPSDYITIKIICIIFCFILYLIQRPIVQEDFDSKSIHAIYVKGIKAFILEFLLMLILMYFKSTIGNAIFVGILSAWILYFIQLKKNMCYQ